jgi:hypothetical protein
MWLEKKQPHYIVTALIIVTIMERTITIILSHFLLMKYVLRHVREK